MNTCRVCYRKKNKKVINFGKHPVSHKFSDGKSKDKKFPLELGQCQACGLVQLTKIIPMKKLVPKFEWITYNEPEKQFKDWYEQNKDTVVEDIMDWYVV